MPKPVLNRVKEIRNARGISLEKLAEKVEKHRSQVQKVEDGDTGLSAKWLTLLSEALDCDPADLITDVPVNRGQTENIDEELMRLCIDSLEVFLRHEKIKLKEPDYVRICADIYNYVLEQRRKFGQCDPQPNIAESIYNDNRKRGNAGG